MSFVGIILRCLYYWFFLYTPEFLSVRETGCPRARVPSVVVPTIPRAPLRVPWGSWWTAATPGLNTGALFARKSWHFIEISSCAPTGGVQWLRNRGWKIQITHVSLSQIIPDLTFTRAYPQSDTHGRIIDDKAHTSDKQTKRIGDHFFSAGQLKYTWLLKGTSIFWNAKRKKSRVFEVVCSLMWVFAKRKLQMGHSIYSPDKTQNPFKISISTSISISRTQCRTATGEKSTMIWKRQKRVYRYESQNYITNKKIQRKRLRKGLRKKGQKFQTKTNEIEITNSSQIFKIQEGSQKIAPSLCAPCRTA